MLRSLPTKSLLSFIKQSAAEKRSSLLPSFSAALRSTHSSPPTHTSSPSARSPSLLPRSTMVNSTSSPTDSQLQSTLAAGVSSTASSSSQAEKWTASTHPDHPTLPFSTFDFPLEQSPLDDRKYKLIRLDNGLEALLIQDEKTDKSTAAMDVKVGHLSDPVSQSSPSHSAHTMPKDSRAHVDPRYTGQPQGMCALLRASPVPRTYLH